MRDNDIKFYHRYHKIQIKTMDIDASCRLRQKVKIFRISPDGSKRMYVGVYMGAFRGAIRFAKELVDEFYI